LSDAALVNLGEPREKRQRPKQRPNANKTLAQFIPVEFGQVLDRAHQDLDRTCENNQTDARGDHALGFGISLSDPTTSPRVTARPVRPFASSFQSNSDSSCTALERIRTAAANRIRDPITNGSLANPP